MPRILACLLAAAMAAPRPAAADDTLRVTLDECVARALDRSEEIRLADADLSKAYAAYLRARSVVLPQLTATAIYTRQIENIYQDTGEGFDLEPFEPDTLAPIEDRVRALEDALPDAGLASLLGLFSQSSFASRNAWIASVGLTQRIFQGGFLWNSIAAARHAMRAARRARADAREDVVLAVRETYLAALRSDRVLRIAALGLEQAETQLARVRVRHEVGEASEFEMLQAEVERDNQVPAVKEAETLREVAYLEVRRIANLPEEPLALATPLLDDAALPAEPAALDTAGIAELALRGAGIESLEEAVAARGHAVGIASSGRWPRLSLFANYGRQAFPEDVFPDAAEWRRNANAGLMVEWNLFDGFETKGAVRDARANRSIAEQSLARAREAVVEAVAQSQGELSRAASDLSARARTAAVARRALDLANLRYEEGVASLLEVSEARIAHQMALSNEARARHDYFAALARLERLTGRPLFTEVAMAAEGGR